MTIPIELDDFGTGNGDEVWKQATVIITGEISYREDWNYNGSTTGYSGPHVESITVIGHPGYVTNDNDAAFEAFLMSEYEGNTKFREMVNKRLLEQCPQRLGRRMAV